MCRSLNIDSVTAQSSKALCKVWLKSRLKASVIPSFDRFSIFWREYSCTKSRIGNPDPKSIEIEMEKFKPTTNQSSNWLTNTLNSLKTFANISKFAGFGGWKRDNKEKTGRNHGKYVCTLSKLPRAFCPASKLLSWTFCSLSKSFCRWDPANHIAWESQIVKAYNIEG